MNRKQLAVMWIGIVLLALTWLFPPWESVVRLPSRPPVHRFYGFAFVNSPSVDGYGATGFEVDTAKLLLIDGCIALVIIGASLTRRSGKGLPS